MMAAKESDDRIRISPKPRAPLSDDQRYELQSLLLKHDQIKPLDKTLRDACITAGWQAKIEERVMEMLRNGEARNMKQLERQIVEEVLGGGQVDGAEERLPNGTQATGGRANEKLNLKVPETAVKAGTKVVRGVLEKAVDVKVEQVEDKEWRDWR